LKRVRELNIADPFIFMDERNVKDLNQIKYKRYNLKALELSKAVFNRRLPWYCEKPL